MSIPSTFSTIFLKWPEGMKISGGCLLEGINHKIRAQGLRLQDTTILFNPLSHPQLSIFASFFSGYEIIFISWYLQFLQIHCCSAQVTTSADFSNIFFAGEIKSKLYGMCFNLDQRDFKQETN